MMWCTMYNKKDETETKNETTRSGFSSNDKFDIKTTWWKCVLFTFCLPVKGHYKRGRCLWMQLDRPKTNRSDGTLASCCLWPDPVKSKANVSLLSKRTVVYPSFRENVPSSSFNTDMIANSTERSASAAAYKNASTATLGKPLWLAWPEPCWLEISLNGKGTRRICPSK